MSLDKVQAIARKMLYDDADRDTAFEAYEQMDHNGWDLPELIRNTPWIRKVISSDPGDAINTGMRILSTLPLSLRYQPLAPGQANKDRANTIENVLRWELSRANRRRSKSVQADVVKSALLYDAVAVQVIDLDYQIKAKEKLNADTNREQAARRISRFMLLTYNPREVHVRYSNIMAEAVLLVQNRHAQDIIDEWGDKAKDMIGLQERAESLTDDWVTYFDYTSYSERAVWLAPGILTDIDAATAYVNWVLLEDKNPLPFLNWVALMGGSTLEKRPEHKYRPLLYPVYTSGAWDVQNIVRTLEVSETIAHSGSPRYSDEGPSVKSANIDFMSPERIAKPAPGNIIKALEPPMLDQALAQVDALLSTQIDKATLSRILQGGQVPAGIAYATLNLATQTAVGALKPAKDLSEKAMAEVFTIMLLWVNFTRKALHAYNDEKDEEDYGTEIVIEPDHVDPAAIYLEVEMHPDAPTDRQQRVNTAALAVQELKMPVATALEEIGITDPTAAITTRYKEMFQDHYVELIMQKNLLELQAAIQVQTQKTIMEIQAQMQAQMQATQAAGPPTGEQGAAPPSTGMLGQGPRGVPRGQGVNPAAGGESPAFFNDEETREMVSGKDFLGNEAGTK